MLTQAHLQAVPPKRAEQGKTAEPDKAGAELRQMFTILISAVGETYN